MARNIEFIPEQKLTQALNVFWRKGYTATSVADLTEAMKLNKSSLYNSFGGKHSLFKQCLKTYGKLVEQDYAAAIKPGDDALKNLDRIIDTILAISTERDNSCLGIKTSFELASDDKEILAQIKAGNDKTIKLIKALIDEAQVDGQVGPGRDTETMAHFVFHSFSGLRQSYIIYGNKELVKAMAGELKTYLRI